MISIPGDELELGWAGDGPGWAGDWSPSENLGFFHFYWEGWQVHHVLLCESIRAPPVRGSNSLPPRGGESVAHSGALDWFLSVAYP